MNLKYFPYDVNMCKMQMASCKYNFTFSLKLVFEPHDFLILIIALAKLENALVSFSNVSESKNS